MNFQPVNFELNENDSINIDFKRIITSNQTIEQGNTLLSNYPNPANEFTYFIFDLKEKKATSLLISIFNINGQKIDSFVPSSSECLWNCSQLVQGSYIYTLSIDNQIIGKNKFQIVK